MTYSSLDFIFFVAFGLLAYSMAGSRFRIYVLFGMTVAWYASWSVYWAGIFLAIAAVNFVFLKRRAEIVSGLGGERMFFVFLLGANAAALLLLKMLPGIEYLMGRSTRVVLSPPVAGRPPLFAEPFFVTPFGVSFFMFMLLAFLVDLWRKAIKAEPENFVEFFVTVAFFPLLMAGPIERYNRLGPQMKRLERVKFENIVNGILIFSLGYVKILWAGDALAQAASSLFNGRNICLSTIILGGFVGSLQAYVVISSYCDMGRGAARCFGIHLTRNFLPVYLAKNPNDYWQRWNISLGAWIRDYLTFPALLRFPKRRYLVIALAFATVGIWHGLSWHWLFFGMVNGCLIAAFLFFQNGPLLLRPRSAGALGFFLVLCLFFLNGLFQDPRSGGLLAELLGNFSLFGDSPAFADRVHLLAPVIPIFVGILALDLVQERTRDRDVLLAMPVWLRSAAVACLIAGFIAQQDRGRVGNVINSVPAYFRF